MTSQSCLSQSQKQQQFSKKRRPLLTSLLSLLVLIGLCLPLAACDDERNTSSKSSNTKYAAEFGPESAKSTLSLVSGSENSALEPLLDRFAQKEGVRIGVDYLGSLDIMRLLQSDTFPYDAVWPASSLWIALGDEGHRVKDMESISITPVIFGIRDSLAEELGFKDRDVFVRDILEAIQAGKLRFTMTSATQSNSGASAYMAFLYALLGNPSTIEEQDLDDETLQKEITELLSGVERSSGSSNWLVDLYVSGNYDAMVNYEALVISANQRLSEAGKETLCAIYPKDGLSLADSPLGFVADNGVAGRKQEEQEELFLKLQNYLLSEDSQDFIRSTGRRTDMLSAPKGYESVFRSDWGIDLERTLTVMRMPKAEVIRKSLDLYQSEFKKPAYNIYLLDFSGSMYGEGNEQLIKALEAIMIEKNARQNLLQASSKEVNVFYRFSDQVGLIGRATGSGQGLEDLYSEIKSNQPEGGTALYSAVKAALEEISQIDLSLYSPAIILMTDGQPSAGIRFGELEEYYEATDIDVPVFSILFGDAVEADMDKLAEMSRARVFDGRGNLVEAFQKVRGYN
ncbi:MAG: VWA domain-containing protein [Eubacteriales bacterium]|nr:VWA domain-containing protein [Eubacteriales bacterium]